MNNNIDISDIENDSLTFKKAISYYSFFWPWFLLTIVLAIFASYTYLRYTPNIYRSNAQIQITKSDASSSFLSTDVTSLFGTQINIRNDISVITSNHILGQVVKRLDLQTTVTEIGRVKSKLLFNDNLPFKIEFKKPNKPGILDLYISNNIVSISYGSNTYKINENDFYENDYFSIKTNKSIFENDVHYTIRRSTVNNSTNKLKNRLSVTIASKGASEIINLSVSGTNNKRNDAILNTLIDVLKDDRISDQRQLSESTIQFIDLRLKTLKKTIDSISKKTITYQIENNIYNTDAQTSNILSTITKENEAVFNLKIQLEIAISLLKKLENSRKFEILPTNIGIDDAETNQLLQSYNILIIERNNLLVSAASTSPIIIQINKQLSDLKSANIEVVSQYIKNLKFSLSSYQKTKKESQGYVSGLPKKGYIMRTMAREFKFAEDLLVFLYQRKEEASISYVSVLPNLKVLSYGISNYSPISPLKQFIYLSAIVFGILIPFLILYLLKILDSKINIREDLEKGLPGLSILGEVPFDENYSSNNDNRSIIAESTRVIRSSMSFLLDQNKPKVVVATSTIKGEGKSFVSYNIAQSYNALGKKVILIGADLRNPQVHTLMGVKRGNLGLSTFLNDVNYNDLDKLIVKGKSIDQIDYLLSGAIPPNPSELLMRPRMKELLEILKSSYDFIIIDTAPLLLVSDTTPLLPLCDLVVYVCRAQYSDKNIFPFIKDIHGRENMPPFGMVLNGLIASPSSSSYGYAYRYSYRYRYSYTYKYNYGYGYGYGRDQD